MPWKNNEDAGDLAMQHAADASEFLNDDDDDETCEECGDHFEDCECDDDGADYHDGDDNYDEPRDIND